MQNTLILLLVFVCLLLPAKAHSAELPVFDLAPDGPVLNANADIYGQNADPADWQGNYELKVDPFFIDPKTGKPDPAWAALTNAFPLHRIRYNWGNRYAWRDTIGPLDKRKPVKHDSWNLHYRSEAGLDEFLRFCESLANPPKVSLCTSPLMPLKDCVDLVAYCNATSGPMAKLRAKNGHPKPYNVMTWEMGNESDWASRADLDVLRADTEEEKKKAITPADYIAAVGPRIKAMRAVDPRIKCYIHAKTAPWFANNPSWPEWHREIIKALGSEIDGVVIHPYYDGYSVPEVMKSIDTLIADCRSLAPKGHRLTVWVSEHARWMNEKNVPESWGLKGAISTADFTIDLMKRPMVEMASYWCYAHTGPWRMLQKDSRLWYATGVFEMFRLLNEAYLPKVQPLQVDQHGYKNNPPAYVYTVNAEMFLDPKTGRKSLVAVNRSPDQSFVLRMPSMGQGRWMTRRLVVTGDSLNASNTPETPDGVTMRESLLVVTPDSEGTAEFAVPARSVTAWILTPAK